MIHRHLENSCYSLAAIDSILERGSLQDWRELFTAARQDLSLAGKIFNVAEGHDLGGASDLAKVLVLEYYPDFKGVNDWHGLTMPPSGSAD